MIDWSDINRIKTLYIERLSELKKVVEEDYPSFAEKMADEERTYLKAKMEAIATLKIEGSSVTLIPALAKGRVADQRFKFKVAESVFHGCRENIKRLHSSIDAYRSLLSTAKSEINIR